MSVETRSEETIFCEALECPTPEARAAYLERVCGADPDLRARVLALLKTRDDRPGFLAEAAVVLPERDLSTVAAAEEQIGQIIGPYRLLEKIGEGGFGTIYVAEQDQPIRRRVAIKIVKLGMDTRQVIARFEAERQALAMMDHPNIARVFDAGATPSGRPFFSMELVRGVPITKYCDEARLTIRQRLDLFLDVCHAVQHAHTKGVIHRDIKPSNILVSRHDDHPVVKVIDFGIAKATGGRLTDKTLYTEFRQLIGTPAYMSPEQAGLSDLDIDTRSDVYSLGVLLYELLTGTTPFDVERLKSSGFDEMRRIIREEEPVKPSTRVSSKLRSAPPGHFVSLARDLRGDLDWIVMKCLEKDRARRYETVFELAKDLTRHLNHQPVLARPTSMGYRIRKFLRRHRTLTLGVGTGVALTLIVATGVQISRLISENSAQKALNRARAVLLDTRWGELAFSAKFQPPPYPDPGCWKQWLERSAVNCENSLGDYQTALERLADTPQHDTIELERDTVRIARLVATAILAGQDRFDASGIPDGYSGRAPATLQIARSWKYASPPQIVSGDELVTSRDDLRSLAFLAYLLGEPLLAERAYLVGGFDQQRDAGPVLDAAIGHQLIWTTNGVAAFDRLKFAANEFPEYGFIAISAADAALTQGNTSMADALLKRGRAAGRLDPFENDCRVQAHLKEHLAAAARSAGRTQEGERLQNEAEAEFLDVVARRHAPNARYRLARMASDRGDFRVAFHYLTDITRRWPRHSVYQYEMARVAEIWWNGLDSRDRADIVSGGANRIGNLEILPVRDAYQAAIQFFEDTPDAPHSRLASRELKRSAFK